MTQVAEILIEKWLHKLMGPHISGEFPGNPLKSLAYYGSYDFAIHEAAGRVLVMRQLSLALARSGKSPANAHVSNGWSLPTILSVRYETSSDSTAHYWGVFISEMVHDTHKKFGRGTLESAIALIQKLQDVVSQMKKEAKSKNIFRSEEDPQLMHLQDLTVKLAGATRHSLRFTGDGYNQADFYKEGVQTKPIGPPDEGHALAAALHGKANGKANGKAKSNSEIITKPIGPPDEGHDLAAALHGKANGKAKSNSEIITKPIGPPDEGHALAAALHSKALRVEREVDIQPIQANGLEGSVETVLTKVESPSGVPLGFSRSTQLVLRGRRRIHKLRKKSKSKDKPKSHRRLHKTTKSRR